MTSSRHRTAGALALVALSLLLAQSCGAGSSSSPASAGAQDAGNDAPDAGGAAASAGSFSGGAGAASKGGNSGKGGSGGKGGQSGSGGKGGQSGAAGCPSVPRPDGVPDDWEEITDWSCDCRFYSPGASGTPPDPIEWEPCSEPVPASLNCRWMKHSWVNPGMPATGTFDYGSIDPATGKPLLLFLRWKFKDHPNWRMHLVAEADGVVKKAILQTNELQVGCELFDDAGMVGDTFAISVVGDTNEGTIYAGSVGVLVSTAEPSSPIRFIKEPIGVPVEETGTPGWNASSKWVTRALGDVKAFPWGSLSNPVVVYDPSQDPDNLPSGWIKPWGDGIFLEAGAGYSGMRAILHWSQEKGLVSLLRYLHDDKRSVGNFGTDGKDMVWTYGDGGQDQQTGAWLNNVVMTAPFSTEPNNLEKNAKKLASDASGEWINFFKVGCGYAARNLHSPSLGNGLFVVRLEDGYSWRLAGSLLSGQAFSYDPVLLITCEEIFVSMITAQHRATIARIPLNSLGPGTPP